MKIKIDEKKDILESINDIMKDIDIVFNKVKNIEIGMDKEKTDYEEETKKLIKKLVEIIGKKVKELKNLFKKNQFLDIVKSIDYVIDQFETIKSMVVYILKEEYGNIIPNLIDNSEIKPKKGKKKEEKKKDEPKKDDEIKKKKIKIKPKIKIKKKDDSKG